MSAPPPGSTAAAELAAADDAENGVYRTTITVTVLHRGRRYAPALNGDLGAIAFDIDEGDVIGGVLDAPPVLIPPERVEGELLDVGNDGTFFGDEYVGLADCEPATEDLS